MAIDACRIKRCDNLYSGDETLIRFINYLRRHWLEQKVHLRGLSGNLLFCIFMIFDDVLLMPETIAIEYCCPMPSEDRNDHDQIEHMLTPILAIDV